MLILPYSILVLIVAGSVALGYAIGRLDWLVARLVSVTPRDFTPAAPVANTLRAAMKDTTGPVSGKIAIDTGKYVGEINTVGMQKTQDFTLGKTIQTQDDISSSVSKLAQLKGK
ncbi:hypothetical protein EBZ80_24010 [bacterium]|nr:hypothetical protein [Betaproteobacteria bacterium]NDE17990.1 hypothetical protein [bacterium]